MPPKYEEFIRRLHDDEAFCAAFAAQPAEVLRGYGLDPDLLDLPPRIDLSALSERIRQRATSPPLDDVEARDKSSQQLWDEFNFIRLRSSAGASTSISNATITALIYGTTAVTNVHVVGVGTAAGLAQLERLSQLRKLSREPRHKLSFAVRGRDDVMVGGLSADVVEALLEAKGGQNDL